METTRLIEEYLDGLLSEEEREAVEKRAASDKDFRELINMHREVNESLGNREFFLLHDMLEKLKNESIQSAQPKHQRKLSFYILRIAAVLILVAGSATLIRYALPEKQEKLFRQHYAPYEVNDVFRSGTDGEILNEAIIKYSEGDYQQALSRLDMLVKEDPKNNLAWFYRGLTCLQLKHPDEAVRSLQSIPKIWDGVFSDHRDWYLALALLKQGNVDEASAMFERIAGLGGFYSQRASIILEKLRK